MNASQEENFYVIVYQAILHISNPSNVDDRYANVLARVEYEISLAVVRGIQLTKVEAFNRVLARRRIAPPG